MSILKKFELKGKTALIAFVQSPYGKEISSALLEAGADVYAASDDPEAAGKTIDELKKDGHMIELLDFCPDNEASIEKLKEYIVAKSGRIDIFILIQPERYARGWMEPDAASIHDNLRKNQMGAMLMTKLIGSEIALNKAGSIIFISPVYALSGPDMQNTIDCPEMFDADFSIDMAFTAGGYVNYARQAASYLGQYNVRVNTVCTAPLNAPREYARAFTLRTTLHRTAQGDDIKGLVVYLASDASSFLTGTTIPLDGGYLAK